MAIQKIGELKLDELVASGKTALHTKVIELAAGSGTLKRGQLIGEKTTTTGSGDAAITTSTYGPIATGFKPFAILCDDVTLGAGTVKALVYMSGHFNGNQVIGYEDSHYYALRDKGIFVDVAMQY